MAEVNQAVRCKHPTKSKDQVYNSFANYALDVDPFANNARLH